MAPADRRPAALAGKSADRHHTVATLGVAEVEGPERQTGVSRSAARGQPFSADHPERSCRRRPPALAPHRPWTTPRGRDGALSAGTNPHQTHRRRSAFPQTAAPSDLCIGAGCPSLGSSARAAVVDESIVRGANPRSRAILQSPDLSPDFLGSSPGSTKFHTGWSQVTHRLTERQGAAWRGSHPPFAALPVPVPQQPGVELARRVARQLLLDVDRPGHLVAGEPLAGEGQEVGLERR